MNQTQPLRQQCRFAHHTRVTYVLEASIKSKLTVDYCTKHLFYVKIFYTWGSTWFRQQLLSRVASSRHTINANLKLNDKSYSFASPALAVA